MSNIESFTVADLSMLIWSHGKLRLRKDSQLLDALRARAVDNVKDFNAEQLADVLKAFSNLGIEPEAVLVQHNAALSSPKKDKSERIFKGAATTRAGATSKLTKERTVPK